MRIFFYHYSAENKQSGLIMEHSVAVRMIQEGVPHTTEAIWADLGAGYGVFTRALADLLSSHGSIIYAIDRDTSALSSIDETEGDVAIKKLHLDFIKDPIPLKDLDGILMANSLHFAKDKKSLLLRLKEILKPQGHFIIIEYDTLTSSPWVPYPINFNTLQKLMMDMGFSDIVKMHDVPSRYNQANLYSVLIK